MFQLTNPAYHGSDEFRREDAERESLMIQDERRYELELHNEEDRLTPAEAERRERSWQAHLVATALALQEALPATAGRALGRGQITGEEYAERATMLRCKGQAWLDQCDREEFVISQSYAWQDAA